MSSFATFALVVATVTLCVGLQHLATYLLHDRSSGRQPHLAFAAACLCMAGYGLLNVGQLETTAPRPWLVGQMVFLPLVTVALLWFVSSLTGRRIPGQGWLQLLLLACALVGLFDPGALVWSRGAPQPISITLPGLGTHAVYELAPGPVVYVAAVAGLAGLVGMLALGLKHARSAHRVHGYSLAVGFGLLLLATTNDALAPSSLVAGIDVRHGRAPVPLFWQLKAQTAP